MSRDMEVKKTSEIYFFGEECKTCFHWEKNEFSISLLAKILMPVQYRCIKDLKKQRQKYLSD